MSSKEQYRDFTKRLKTENTQLREQLQKSRDQVINQSKEIRSLQSILALKSEFIEAQNKKINDLTRRLCRKSLLFRLFKLTW